MRQAPLTERQRTRKEYDRSVERVTRAASVTLLALPAVRISVADLLP